MTDNGRGTRHWKEFVFSMPSVYAVLFCLGLVIFEYFVFRPKYPRLILIRHWTDENYFRLEVFLVLASVATGLAVLLFRAAFSSRAAYRVVYLILFLVSVAVEYSLYGAFGRFSKLDDIALALVGIDLRIGSEAVLAYFNWLALLPVTVFAGLLLLTRGRRELGAGALAAVLVLFGAFFAVTTYFTRNEFYAPSMSNAFRTAVSFPVSWYVGTIEGPPEAIAYARPREQIAYRSPIEPRNNIVFIVDESIRGDRLSLNGYGVPTSPFLDELHKNGRLKNWGIAAAGTTCSHTANPLLLTGLTELPDREFMVHRMPTIFQFARAMNYRNYYFDGQVSGLWNGKPSDVADFGVWIKAADLRGNAKDLFEIDAEIARRVNAIVRSSTGNFIWVNKFGVHTPYTNSFPNERLRETLEAMPADYDPDIGADALGKLYDDAVTYNVESFFSALLVEDVAADTIYLYTSDHGQTLRENGATASHCMETRPEAIVPLFMIADRAKLASIDESYRPAHANLFATLLDLMAFPESERRHAYASSLLKAQGSESAPRFFYGGELNKARKIPFD